MKHFLSFGMIVCCLWCLSFTAKAQNTHPIPNGDFEAWSNVAGYELTISTVIWGATTTFSVPVFEGFSHPTFWNYPSLYVNDTITIQNPITGSDVDAIFNTNVPLIKVIPDTMSENNTAVMMQTFKVSDVIVPGTYTFLESSLSTDLQNMIIPSILSSGEIHVDSFFTLLNNILSNVDSVENFIGSFDGLDLNQYISGGIALNGFVPGKISGLYKYVSAEMGDNGAVLMLGTKYDTLNHVRTVVGGGLGIDLTDASFFTPFDVYYHPANTFDSNLEYIEPDTLVVLVLSSASNNLQQYSTLYLDDLTLWEADSNDVENTCSRAYFIHVSDVDTSSALLSWYELETPDHWEVEYGLQDFELGTGTAITTTDLELELTGLQTDTYYDVYIRAACEDSLFSNWTSLRFKTEASYVPEDTTGGSSIQNITNLDVTIYPNPAHGNCTLQFDKQQPCSIQLYAIDGKLLQTITPNSRTINLSLPYSGIFIIRCETENGAISRRIINFQ